MQAIRIWIILTCSIAYSVSNIQSHEIEDFEDDTTPLPFQDQIEQVFDAFVKDDNVRMENTFEFLLSIDPDQFNQLNEANHTADYKRERIDYVVSVKEKSECRRKFHVEFVLFKPNQIRSAGYPVEIHQIKTGDGYILHAFRIPYGQKSPQTKQSKPLVLIMHGLMDSSNGKQMYFDFL